MSVAGATRAAAGLTELQRLDVRRCADVAARRSVVLVVHGVIVMPQRNSLLRKLGQHNLGVQQKTWSTWLHERSNSGAPATDKERGACDEQRGRSSRKQRSMRRMDDYISAKRQKQQQLAAAELLKQQEQQLEQEQLQLHQSWLLFCAQRQQQEDELAALDAAANSEAALDQLTLTTTTTAAAATGEQRRPEQPPQQPQEQQQLQQQAQLQQQQAAEQRRGAAAAAAHGKRQRVGETAIDLEMVVAQLPPHIDLTVHEVAPAAAAAIGRASRARPAGGPAATPSAPARRSAPKPPARPAKPPPPQKKGAAARPLARVVARGRQAMPSRAGRAAWPAIRGAAVRAGLEFQACHSCGEPAYEGTLCGRGGGYCEHNDEMNTDDEGAPAGGE